MTTGRIVGVLFLALVPLRGQDVDAFVKRTFPSVVKVRTFDHGRVVTMGCGFFVAADGLIVTDGQVIGDSKVIEVETADGQRHTGVAVEATDPIHGLVLLRVPDISSVRPLLLSSAIPQTGENVMVVAPEKTARVGVISDVLWVPTASRTNIVPLHPSSSAGGSGMTLIKMTAFVPAGDSGSPVLNRSGEVIGVATFRPGEGENASFAISSKHVKEMLESPGFVRDSIALLQSR